MSNEIFVRNIALLGEEDFICLQTKKVLVAGLGGVGGTTFEALVRTGVKNFVIVDRDVVDPTNLNRQLLYTSNDIGKDKVLCAKNRALSINKDASIIALKEDIKNLDNLEVDFIVDCIDDVEAKIYLINYALTHNIPIISSMGMANKVDPSKIKIASLNKSTGDPLAKKMRYELKKANIDYSNLMCVYSDEAPYKDGNKLYSLITVTSVAGLLIANYVVNVLKRN